MAVTKYIKPYVEHGEKAGAVRKITVSIPLHVLKLLSDERTRRQVNNLRHATNSDLLVEAFLHAFTGQELPKDDDLQRILAAAAKPAVVKKPVAKKAAVKNAAVAKKPTAAAKKKPVAKKAAVKAAAKKPVAAAVKKPVAKKAATAKPVATKLAAKPAVSKLAASQARKKMTAKPKKK